MSGTVALWFNNCSLCLINLLKTCRLYSLHITQQRRGGSSPGAIKEAVIDHRSENGTPGKIALIQTPVLPSLIILQGMKRTPPNILFFCLQCISMRPIWFFFAPIVSQKIRATSDWHSMPTQHICSMNIYQHLSSVQNPLSFHCAAWWKKETPLHGWWSSPTLQTNHQPAFATIYISGWVK